MSFHTDSIDAGIGATATGKVVESLEHAVSHVDDGGPAIASHLHSLRDLIDGDDLLCAADVTLIEQCITAGDSDATLFESSLAGKGEVTNRLALATNRLVWQRAS